MYSARTLESYLSKAAAQSPVLLLTGARQVGKTTLLRLILGELKADSGKVRLGTKIQVAYFDQFRTQLDEEATLADVISPGLHFNGAQFLGVLP